MHMVMIWQRQDLSLANKMWSNAGRRSCRFLSIPSLASNFHSFIILISSSFSYLPCLALASIRSMMLNESVQDCLASGALCPHPPSPLTLVPNQVALKKGQLPVPPKVSEAKDLTALRLTMKMRTLATFLIPEIMCLSLHQIIGCRYQRMLPLSLLLLGDGLVRTLQTLDLVTGTLAPWSRILLMSFLPHRPHVKSNWLSTKL